MGEVTPIGRRTTNLRCAQCGAEWFTVRAVTFDAETREVGGYTWPARCTECGLAVPE